MMNKIFTVKEHGMSFDQNKAIVNQWYVSYYKGERYTARVLLNGNTEFYHVIKEKRS